MKTNNNETTKRVRNILLGVATVAVIIYILTRCVSCGTDKVEFAPEATEETATEPVETTPAPEEEPVEENLIPECEMVLIGEETMEIGRGERYQELGVQLLSKENGKRLPELEKLITFSGNVNEEEEGEYLLTYAYENMQLTRTVKVVDYARLAAEKAEAERIAKERAEAKLAAEKEAARVKALQENMTVAIQKATDFMYAMNAAKTPEEARANRNQMKEALKEALEYAEAIPDTATADIIKKQLDDIAAAEEAEKAAEEAAKKQQEGGSSSGGSSSGGSSSGGSSSGGSSSGGSSSIIKPSKPQENPPGTVTENITGGTVVKPSKPNESQPDTGKDNMNPEGGDSEGGDSEGGDSEGGDSEGGDSEGGDSGDATT